MCLTECPMIPIWDKDLLRRSSSIMNARVVCLCVWARVSVCVQRQRERKRQDTRPSLTLSVVQYPVSTSRGHVFAVSLSLSVSGQQDTLKLVTCLQISFASPRVRRWGILWRQEVFLHDAMGLLSTKITMTLICWSSWQVIVFFMHPFLFFRTWADYENSWDNKAFTTL